MTRGIQPKTTIAEDTGLAGANGYQPDTVYRIPLEELSPDPNQPRVQFDGIVPLADVIQREGFRGAIGFRLACPEDGVSTPLIIVDGERRYRACQHLKLATIPGLLDTQAEPGPELRYRQATANDHGKPLTQWDWACLIRQLRDDYGLTFAKIADDLAERGLKTLSRPALSNLYRLHQLPTAAQDLVKDGWLTAAAGKYLLGTKHPDVLTSVTTELAKEVQREGAEQPTVAHIQNLIANDYRTQMIGLGSGYAKINGGWGQIEFDPKKECVKCVFRHLVTSYGRKEAFCIKEDCFREKQEVARAARVEKQAAESEQQGEPKKDKWELERERRQAHIQALEEEMPDTAESHVLAIICLHTVECCQPYDERQKDPLTLQQIATQLELAGGDTLRTMAGWILRSLHDAQLAQAAELLQIDLETVSRETDQPDPLEAQH